MRQRVLGAATCAALLTCTALALAGTKISNPVTVASTYATGTLGNARASADTLQYIGCTSWGSSGSCYARDASGNGASCFWSTPAQATAVGSITPMSNITFYWDASGNCTSLEVANLSYFLPATP